MACFLSFGCRDLVEYSSLRKVAAVALDLLVYPLASVIISVVAASLLAIKFLFKSLAYIFSHILCRPSEVSIKNSFGDLKLESAWAHLVLVPVIGSIAYGSIIAHQGDREGLAELGSLDSFVLFFEAPCHYLSRITSW